MARRVILVLIALLVSGGAIFLAQQWLRGSSGRPMTASTAPARTAPPIQVLVAKTDLYSGQFIRPDSLTWQAWPAGPLPDAYLVQGKVRPAELVGAVVRSRLTAGQPVTLGQVVRPGDRGFMAAVLTPGQRAVTVNVNASTGVAGFVFPGDHVDLILTMTVQSAAGVSRHVSETILRDVRIVGMDQSFTDGRKDDKADLSIPKTATLEVTPKQAEIVFVAADLGVLSLALRSVAGTEPQPGDRPVSKTWDVEATQIALAAHAPPATNQGAQNGQPAQQKYWTINIVHGGATVVTPIPGITADGRRTDK